MKKTVLFLLLFALISMVNAEPVQLGFVINDNVPVYADSNTQSTVLETLELTDYRYVYGDTNEDGYNYNYNGWAKMAVNNSTIGWVEYKNLLVTRYMSFFAHKGDGIYTEPDTSTFENQIKNYDRQIKILEILEKDDQIWLKMDDWDGIYWYLSDTNQLDFNTLGYYFTIFHVLFYGGNLENHYVFYNNDQLNRGPDNAETFLLKLKSILDPYRNVYLLSYDDYGNTVEYNGAGALINDMLSWIYKRGERWDDLISILSETMIKYPHQWLLNGRAGAIESLRLADLYRDELNDATKAVELYHTIIRDYHDELLEGDEWNYWADLRAADNIYNIIKDKDPDFIKEQSNKIIKESRNIAVKLVAYKGTILVYALLNNYDQVGGYVSSMLRHYPDVYKNYYLSTRNLSIELADLMFSILRDSCQYEHYHHWADMNIEDCKGYPLAGFCAFKKAELADYTQSDNEYIKSLYQAALDSFPEYSFDNFDVDVRYSSYNCENRYNALVMNIPVNATVLHDGTPLYRNPIDTVNATMLLSKGEKVVCLSTDLNMINYNSWYENFDSPECFKIMLADSTIGWVRYDALESDKTLDAIKADNHKSWTMYKGDSENNLYFTGPEITDPVISGNLYAGSVRGLRFYDVNNDDVLDYLFVNNYIVQIIDGKTNELIDQYYAYGASDYIIVTDDRLITHNIGNNRTILLKCFDLEQKHSLWQVESGRYYYPVYHNGKLFCSSPDSGIQCINMDDGSVLWETGIEYNYPAALAANEKAVIVSDQRYVLALNPETGEQLWYKDLGKYIDKQIPVLDHDRLYYMITSNTFAALEITTGEVIWQFSYTNDSYFNLQPIITPKYVVYSPYKDNITVLDRRTGEKVWQNIFDQLLESYCVGGNTIYAQFEQDYYDFSTDPDIYAFNLFTGNEMWRRYYPNGNPIIYQGGKLFLSGESGLVVVEDKLNEEQIRPDDFILYPNYPNPFNSGTVIQYALSTDSQVSVDIYNVLGQKIATLVDGLGEKGVHHTFWNGTADNGQHVGNGIYFYRIRIGDRSSVRAMTLLK